MQRLGSCMWLCHDYTSILFSHARSYKVQCKNRNAQRYKIKSEKTSLTPKLPLFPQTQKLTYTVFEIPINSNTLVQLPCHILQSKYSTYAFTLDNGFASRLIPTVAVSETVIKSLKYPRKNISFYNINVAYCTAIFHQTWRTQWQLMKAI